MSLFSQHKHHIGSFNLFRVRAMINQDVNCRQKHRSKILPEGAKLDLNALRKSGVFQDANLGTDKFCANITLTVR